MSSTAKLADHACCGSSVSPRLTANAPTEIASQAARRSRSAPSGVGRRPVEQHSTRGNVIVKPLWRIADATPNTTSAASCAARRRPSSSPTRAAGAEHLRVLPDHRHHRADRREPQQDDRRGRRAGRREPAPHHQIAAGEQGRQLDHEHPERPVDEQLAHPPQRRHRGWVPVAVDPEASLAKLVERVVAHVAGVRVRAGPREPQDQIHHGWSARRRARGFGIGWGNLPSL